jgi:hypothetical protein
MVNSQCIGVKANDHVEVFIHYPDIKYNLDDREKPISYSLKSLEPIRINPTITRYLGVALRMVKVFDQVYPFIQNPLISALPQIEKIHAFNGKIPGVFVSLILRCERSEFQITRVYYSFLEFNKDFGSMVETITIVMAALYYIKGRTSYEQVVRATVSAIAAGPCQTKDQNLHKYVEIQSLLTTVVVHDRTIRRFLFKGYQTSLFRLIVHLTRELPKPSGKFRKVSNKKRQLIGLPGFTARTTKNKIRGIKISKVLLRQRLRSKQI